MPSSDKPLNVAGIILAAGASQRMGTNKMLLELEGVTLIRRACTQALVAGLKPVVVVLGRDAPTVRLALRGLDCTFAYNPDFTAATSSSLHIGIEHLPNSADAIVIMLADMIHVTAPMLEQLIQTAQESAVPAVASRYGDVWAPPLLFRRTLFNELLDCHGEGCGKAIVKRHRSEALFVDWPPEALTDVDTPEEWARISSLLSHPSTPK